MPAAVIWIGGGAALLWLARRFVDESGQAVDEAGNGALKLAGAGAIGVGAWIALRRFG